MSLQRVFAVVRQALKGDHQSFTEGSIPEAVVLLAIPMILELSLESVFAVVDMFFVSKLGQNAVATVGLTESVITIVYSVAIGLSAGATALVARRTGEKNPDGAAHAGVQAMLVGLVASIILGIAGAVFAADILHLMGASQDVVDEGTSFAQIMLGASIPIVFLFLMNGIFRGAGDAAMAMRSLWIASGVNIVLCPIMIHVFGLKGAAIATVIGRSSGVAYQCFHLLKGDGILQIARKHFGVDPAVIKSLFNVAWPATFQFIIGSGSWIILTRLVAETGGMAASAGYQIAFRNFVFFILPAWGLSNAAATLVGQNLGAKQLERAEESVYVTARYSVYLMGAVTVFFMLFARSVVEIFSSDELVVQHGTTALRIIGAGYVFYGVSMVFTQALNGAGDSKTPTWINFLCFWVIQIPLAYLCVHGLGMGAAGAVIVIPVAHGLLAIIAYLYFKQGKWKTVEV